MTFPLIKKFGGARYSAFNDQAQDRTPSPVASRSASETTRAPSGDMISFSDGEETPSPSHARVAAQHDRTLSGESATTHWAEVLTGPAGRTPVGALRPRRHAPPVPETLEAHLQRLGPDAADQRAHVARSILGHAAREWQQPYPMPVYLDRMQVQSFKHVHLSDDVGLRKALICTEGLHSPAVAAKHFWATARNAVFEVYMYPRPNPADPGRSVYYPKAAADIAKKNPNLHATLSRIDATDFSQAGALAVTELLGELAPST